MRRWFVTALVPVLFAACGKSGHSEGLPPASDWSSSQVAPNVQLDELSQDDNPAHAGLDMDNGGEAPGPVDPSAPLPPGHPSMTGPAPAGAASSGPGGLPPPDPNRAIDPSRRIAGTVRIDPKLASTITEATPMFIFVKRYDANGNPTGFPIATQRVVWTPGKDYAFELTERDIMAGIPDTLTGDFVVTAHVDHDGDAMTKTPGDLLGMARATVPAASVVITLDTAVP